MDTAAPLAPGPAPDPTAGPPPGLGTVLGVWAHPDDETYLSGGLMALARAAGHRVVCVHATRGELGTTDPHRWPPDRLAAVREREIAAALRTLGVAEQQFLGHRDGTLADVDPALGIAQVAAAIEAVRPDTTVTFGPDGMTGHPDHVTVSTWTTEAWRRTGRPGRLLHATSTTEHGARFGDLADAVAMAGTDHRVPALAEVDLAVALDGPTLDIKVAALRAHATQVGPLLAWMGEARFRDWVATESFTAVAA